MPVLAASTSDFVLSGWCWPLQLWLQNGTNKPFAGSVVP